MTGKEGLTNLLSKKLITVETAIAALIYLAMDAPDKLPYCYLIAGIAVIYKICQTALDWKKNKSEE